jgi:hypothetical protein
LNTPSMQACQYLPTEKSLDRIVKKAHDPRHIIILDLVSVNHIDGDECISCIISCY